MPIMKKLQSFFISTFVTIFLIACNTHDNVDAILRDALEELSLSIQISKSNFEKVGFRAIDQKNILVSLSQRVSVYNTEVNTEMPSNISSGVSVIDLFTMVERFAIEDGPRLIKNKQFAGVIGLSAKAQELQRLALAIAQAKQPDQENSERFAQPAVRLIVNSMGALLGRVKCLSDFASQNATNGKVVLHTCNALASAAILVTIPNLTNEMIDFTKENTIESINKVEKVYEQLQTLYADSKLEKKNKISHNVDKLIDKVISLKENISEIERNRNIIHMKFADSYLDSYAQLASSTLESALLMADPSMGQKYSMALSQLSDTIISMNLISFKKSSKNPLQDNCGKKSGIDCIAILMMDNSDVRSAKVSDFYNEVMGLISDTNELCPSSNLCNDGMELQKRLMSFNLQYIGLQNQTNNMNNQFEMISSIMKSNHDIIKSVVSALK